MRLSRSRLPPLALLNISSLPQQPARGARNTGMGDETDNRHSGPDAGIQDELLFPQLVPKSGTAPSLAVN